MSLAMTVAKLGGEAGGGRRFPPAAGTTTYPGVTPMGMGPTGTMRMGPGGAYGDPGLFSFLGKAVKGVTGIVSKLGIPIISGAAGVVGGLLGGGAKGPGITPTFAPGQMPLTFQGLPATQPRGGVIAAGQRAFLGGQTGMGEGCAQGYRPNKSAYYVQGGQRVEPGTVCVKRRRMNPLNPRALSKAMRRIESAKRATTVLGRITIRKKC